MNPPYVNGLEYRSRAVIANVATLPAVASRMPLPSPKQVGALRGPALTRIIHGPFSSDTPRQRIRNLYSPLNVMR